MFIGLKPIGILTALVRELPAVRIDSTAYNKGDVRTFGGFVHRCAFAGTSGIGVPAIIAPVGADNLVTNGDFPTDLTGWVADAAVSVVAGEASIDGTQAAFGFPLQQAGIITIGHTYLTSFKIGAVSQDGARLRTGNGAAGQGTIRTTAATFEEVLEGAGSVDLIVQSAGGTGLFIGTVDDISVIQVTGDGTAAWETIGYA